MIRVIKSREDYWSRADAFVLPLTGLQKKEQYEIGSYLYWEKHTIEHYKLILSIHYEDKDKFLQWCNARLFPVLDKGGYLLESYDYNGRAIFVLDMAAWAKDIEMMLAGKYSKIAKKTKEIIEDYHTFNGNQVPIHLYAALNPRMKMSLLTDGNKVLTPIEYVVKFYEFDADVMESIGEIGGAIEPGYETLYVDVNSFCQNDMKEGEV